MYPIIKFGIDYSTQGDFLDITRKKFRLAKNSTTLHRKEVNRQSSKNQSTLRASIKASCLCKCTMKMGIYHTGKF